MKEETTPLVKDAYKLIVRKPLVVERSTPLSDVVTKFIKDSRQRVVFVLDENVIKGIITIRELIRILAVEERLDNTKRLHECAHTFLKHNAECAMNKHFVAVTPGDSVADVIKKMEEQDLYDLPVIDDKGSLIGVLNGLEVLAACRKLWLQKD